MYPITNEVKALFESEQRKVLRITGTDRNGASISITDDNVIEDSFQIDRYSCNGEKLEIGTAIAAQLTLKLENGNGQYDGIVFEGAELFAEVGIADWTQSSPTVTYIPCGYFTPDDQPRRLSIISITALDRMAKFDAVVDGTQITTPITVANLVARVCTLRGVTLAQSITGLTNANVSLPSVPSGNSVTYRNLIAWCAGIMGTNAWFDWNGQLRFSWYNNATGYASTVDNRYSSDMYENDLTVTGVVYTTTGGIDIVEGTDDYALDLTGNTLASPMITTILPALNTALNGFTYRPFTAAAVNAPYLWPMDAVTFTDKEGNDHASLLTNVCFGLNGTTAMEARGMTYVLNRQKLPEGFTKEQAQLINEVSNQIKEDIDDSLTQQDIFNRLTDNGAAQGLVLYDGQLYINASYINAGMLNARFINFNAPVDDFAIPNENDPDTLLDGQTVTGGWIVNESGSREIVALECDYAKLLRGRTITLKFTFNGELSFCEYAWDSLDGPSGTGVVEPVSPANPYTYYFTVPDEADNFRLVMTCGGLKQIDATVSGSQIVYPDDIRFTYAGLQIGKFLVDRSGNLFGKGQNQFDGTARFNGDVYFRNPSAVRTNLEITPANIGAVAKTGDTMTGPLEIDNTLDHGFKLKSPNNDIEFLIGLSDNNRGIYDYKLNKWIYGINNNGDLLLGGTVPVGSGGTGATQGTIDITDQCSWHGSFYSKNLIYNPYLKMVFGSFAVYGNVANQAYLVTLPSSVPIVSKTPCGIGTSNTNGVAIAVDFEGRNLKSSHSVDVPVSEPRYVIQAYVG